MDIKSGLEEVKKELSKDEKLLEQAFHLEKFLKKYKTPLIIFAVISILSVVGYNIYSSIKYSKLEKANSALLALQQNPKDSNALNILKENNPKLYALYNYSIAANSANKEALSKIDKNGEFLEDVINYHLGVIEKNPKDSKYYKNLALLQKAYLMIKENKKDKARTILAQIPKNSTLAPIANLLLHYTITK